MRPPIPVLCVAFCVLPFSATAAEVTTSVWTQYSATVTQPELIHLGGVIHVVTKITQPSDPCSLSDPCRGVTLRWQLNLAGVTGVGQTTGKRYQVGGAAGGFSGVFTMPGGFVASAALQLETPDPIIPPTPIDVHVILAADSSGNVTASGSQPEGLVGWWQAEGDATDALGVSNNIANQGAVFVPGRVEQAFGFAGSGNVLVPDSPSLRPDTLTVMAWVQHLGPPAVNTTAYVLSKGAQLCQGASFAIYTSPAAQNLMFGISDGTNFAQSADTGPYVWDGNWHFIAGTYDGAFVRFYVDGVEVTPATAFTLTINYALPTHSNFYIGAYVAPGYCTIPFNGSIDEVRVFNRTLSASEILRIYQTTP